jgi:hypothetical protein
MRWYRSLFEADLKGCQVRRIDPRRCHVLVAPEPHTGNVTIAPTHPRSAYLQVVGCDEQLEGIWQIQVRIDADPRTAG